MKFSGENWYLNIEDDLIDFYSNWTSWHYKPEELYQVNLSDRVQYIHHNDDPKHFIFRMFHDPEFYTPSLKGIYVEYDLFREISLYLKIRITYEHY